MGKGSFRLPGLTVPGSRILVKSSSLTLGGSLICGEECELPDDYREMVDARGGAFGGARNLRNERAGQLMPIAVMRSKGYSEPVLLLLVVVMW